LKSEMDKIIDISELIPDNENANKGSEFGNSLIEKSLRKFGAGGTTMVACEQMGRNARMVEIEPTYCQVIIDRMKKLFPIIEINKIG